MAINKSEFLTIKKYVTKDLLQYCLFDAVAEAIIPAYEELYGTEMPNLNDSDQRYEHFLRLNRLSDYATHFLVELDPIYASHEYDDRICRDIDCFDRVNPWKYVVEYEGDTKTEVVWDCVDTWTAKEWDTDGDLSHFGTGRTAQEALNAMRLVIPDDLLDEQ